MEGLTVTSLVSPFKFMQKGDIALEIAYGVIFFLSLLLLPGYFLFLHKKQSEPLLFGLFLCVCVVNSGYLLLSLSKTLEFALFANKLAYLGQVFLIMFMFQIISKLCGISYKRWFRVALVTAAILMFGIVCTTGHLDWYYKSAELVSVDGAVKLEKEYGVLHPLYLFYILFYFVSMLTVAILSIRRSKGASHKLTGLMLAVVIGNIGMWLVEKLITWNFEFLSVSYLMSEYVFFFLYVLLLDYVHVTDLPSPAHEEKPAVIFADSAEKAVRIQRLLELLPEGISLSPRQLDILEGILDGKPRKEIAADLHLSENTVKMHTTSLYKALGVSGREEIYALIQK